MYTYMYIYIYIYIYVHAYIHIHTHVYVAVEHISRHFFLGIFRVATAYSLAVGKREGERPISSVTFHLRQRALYFRKKALYLRKSDMYFRVAVRHISIYTFMCVCVYIYILVYVAGGHISQRNGSSTTRKMAYIAVPCAHGKATIHIYTYTHTHIHIHTLVHIAVGHILQRNGPSTMRKMACIAAHCAHGKSTRRACVRIRSVASAGTFPIRALLPLRYAEEGVCCNVLWYVAVCCSVLQCVAVRCSALQCIAVFGALQCLLIFVFSHHRCHRMVLWGEGVGLGRGSRMKT